MILQALNEYYDRKRGSGELAREGFDYREIPFVIVITREGRFLQLDDTRKKEEKRLVAKRFLIPQERERSGSSAYEITNVLWDHYGYVLAHPKSEAPSDVEMARKQAQSFISLAKKVATFAPDDVTLKAVCAFLNSDEERRSVFNDQTWPECAKIPGCNLSFRLEGENALACEAPSVKAFLECDAPSDNDDDGSDLSAIEGFCLVSGIYGPLARTHPRTPIPGSKSNAKLVSFQKNSGFDSYGKEQSYNAPVSESVARTYTKALKHLLGKRSKQRLVGDTSTVFWAANESDFEDGFAAIFGGGDKDDPDRGTQAVRNLLESTRTGVYLKDDADTRFCVLGLAPNAARIAVRFWQIGPVKQFAGNIAQHFRDIEIDKPAYESGYLSLFRLLNSIALLNKSENVPPDLAGDTMRAILAGLPYPATLLQAAIRRCRAEQAARNKKTNKQAPNVPYPRAAIIKASLNRLIHHKQFKAKELAMSLDKSNNAPAYRLGRLFAALERIQSAAQPGINATIRDRYYGAASSSPASVFPVLLKLKNHHLSKLDNAGLAAWFEKILREIFGGLAEFPSHLSLTEQGLFAIGYYHQQQDFFRGKPKHESDSPSNSNEEQ